MDGIILSPDPSALTSGHSRIPEFACNMLSGTVGVLAMISNGQDNQTDNNSTKGFGDQIAWGPKNNVALFFNYFGRA
jgi:hypothetical protein